MPDLTRGELAAYVDHTLLRPEATVRDVAALAAEAVELGVYAVCVSPSMLPLRGHLGDVRVATVCGFPSGKHATEIKVAEAADAIERGAHDIDMVIDIGALRGGERDRVVAEISAVRAACERAVLKVIIESAALTEEQIVTAAEAAMAAGADFVKTSTGFHPSGGASVAAVALLAQTVGGQLGVKASGGIRTYADAIALLDAGATRLGLSATAAVLAGCPG